MIQGIDHLVIVVNDLRRAAEDYAHLGFTAVPGGKHPVGTHNVLIPFADGSYIEIIGFYREAPDHRWWQALKTGERLVDFCLQTDDLQGDTEKLRAAGVAINDPVPWSRTRPDGYELKWILSLATGADRGLAPFLIHDVTPREQRIPHQVEHPNGIIGIASLTVAVDGLSKISRWYETVLGFEGERLRHELFGGEGLRFKIGRHLLEFVSPTELTSPLIDWIKTYGPSPYAATLHSRGSSPRVFDTRLTHGANLLAVT
jgi:catechol 2,3-dioxygenase-like lactoylglutathione lyase family enzyme